jgi:hypothetical protein
MPRQTTARLKSTGESVRILNNRQATDVHYAQCRLPPQAPGHQPRFQWVRLEQLYFRD